MPLISGFFFQKLAPTSLGIVRQYLSKLWRGFPDIAKFFSHAHFCTWGLAPHTIFYIVSLFVAFVNPF